MHAPKQHYADVQCMKVYILEYCNIPIFLKVALFSTWYVNIFNMMTTYSHTSHTRNVPLI